MEGVIAQVNERKMGPLRGVQMERSDPLGDFECESLWDLSVENALRTVVKSSDSPASLCLGLLLSSCVTLGK